MDSKKCWTCNKEIIRLKEWSPHKWMVKQFCNEKCQHEGYRRGYCTNKGTKWNKKSRESFSILRKKLWHKNPLYGKDTPNWKGGTVKLNKLIRELDGAIKWRCFCFERDNFTCQLCGQRGGSLEVHHKIPLSEIIDIYEITTTEEANRVTLLFEITNGVTLCKECHNKVHKILL